MASDVHNWAFLMDDTPAALGVASRGRSDRISPGWVAAPVIAGLVVALYAKIIPDLALEWWTVEASSYGLLIPPLCLYIAYLRRTEVLAVPVRADMWGLCAIALACVCFLVGALAAEFFLSRISIVLLLAGLVWTFWGRQRLKVLGFPFILLATMVPPPTIVYNAVATPLQLFASHAAATLAQAVGVSVFCEGNIIHLAHTSLGVEEACSGLQSLSALLVASLLLGYLERATVRSRVLLFILAAPLAVAVNIVRVAGTAILADFHMEFAMGFYHSFSGWLVFLIGFAVLWLLAKALFRWTGTNAHA